MHLWTQKIFRFPTFIPSLLHARLFKHSHNYGKETLLFLDTHAPPPSIVSASAASEQRGSFPLTPDLDNVKNNETPVLLLIHSFPDPKEFTLSSKTAKKAISST